MRASRGALPLTFAARPGRHANARQVHIIFGQIRQRAGNNVKAKAPKTIQILL
jgi:hypothetical protein